jgi:hypothetical protein
MGFINDAIFYNSGNECPPEFIEWAGISTISALAGRKLWVQHGEFTIFLNTYICLVAEAAGGKSTARHFEKKMINLVDPDYVTSASFQSHQDIIDTMCNMMPHAWTDDNGEFEGGEKGKVYEYRPFLISSNELKSLLSTDTKGMIDFMVDIYDENAFSTGYKTYKRNNPERKQDLTGPYLCMLACATPKWFMGELKIDLFDGGLGRRLLIVNGEKANLIDTPVRPVGHVDALLRMQQFLLKVKEAKGEMVRTPEAMKFWKDWYYFPDRKKTDDPILKQFLDNKHIPLLKLSALLALSEDPTKRMIEVRHMQQALLMLARMEKGVSNLTRGIGRNELSGIGLRVLDFITKLGGVCGKVQLLKAFGREFRMPEFVEQMNQYIQSEQLKEFVDQNTGKTWYAIPEMYEQYLRKKAAETTQPPVP